MVGHGHGNGHGYSIAGGDGEFMGWDTAKEKSKARLDCELNRFLALSVQRVLRNLSIVDTRRATVKLEKYRGKSDGKLQNIMERKQLH
jgi:hypothetical protein